MTLVYLGDMVVSNPVFKGYCSIADYSMVILKGIASDFQFDIKWSSKIRNISVSTLISNLKIKFCHLRLSISSTIRSLELFGVLQCGDRIVGQGRSKITIHWSHMSQGRVLAILMIILVSWPSIFSIIRWLSFSPRHDILLNVSKQSHKRSIKRRTSSLPPFSQSSAHSDNKALCHPGFGLFGSPSRGRIPFPSAT
jgi:hypothetical protein